jgi:Peptidase family M23
VLRPTTLTFLLFAAAAFGFAAVWDPKVGIPGFIAACVSIAAILVWRRVDVGGASKRWLARASNRPIVLRAPFEDRWRVIAGGPDPRHNPHQRVSDQVFAYDFERDGGASWDSTILAPCDGMIVHVENRCSDAPPGAAQRDRKKPFGNYVSIQTERGYVILAHLRQGSVSVRVGERVQTGVPIGRCGNSGNSRRAHLHVHAQNRPSEAIATADGVPIAFLDRGASEPMLLEYGDTLG